MQMEEPKPIVAQGQSQPTVAAKRKSRRETEWSAPSEPVLTVKPAAVYVAKSDDKVEKLECVFVEFDKERSVYVPRKENTDAGWVFGTTLKVKGKEAPFDIIHPIKKMIKALKVYKTSNFVTVVDSKGAVPLQMGNASKDPIKTGRELVSFDPLTGQLTISREFDNFTNFHMFTQPDMPAIGPLGGGLGGAGASGYGGGGYGSGSGDEGGMGLGGMSGSGGTGGPSGLGGAGSK